MNLKLLAGTLTFLLPALGIAQTASKPASDWTGYVGAGVASFPRYTGGKGADVSPVPLLMFEYKETYYVDLMRAGVRLWSTDDKKFALGLAAEPRFGFKAKDGGRLAGMAKRRHSIEVGPSLEWETQLASLNFAWFNDVLGTSKGSSWRASAYKQLVNTSSWDLGTYVSVERESARVVNYYFGVPAAEVTASRPFYAPGAATHLSLGLQAAWKFTPRHSLMMGVQNTRIGSPAVNSPIVETRNAPIGYIGLGWNL
jgi:outer membrane protein